MAKSVLAGEVAPRQLRIEQGVALFDGRFAASLLLMHSFGNWRILAVMNCRLFAILAIGVCGFVVLPVVSIGCSKSDASLDKSDSHAPKLPEMPNGWKLVDDKELSSKLLKEEESRLEGKVKAIRQTTYNVNGQKVQLSTIVAANTNEADKIYRILSNKKIPDTLARNGEILYEFAGPEDALLDVKKARALLAP
jgi:hypothetical protein